MRKLVGNTTGGQSSVFRRRETELKINVGHRFISLDELGYALGMALMIIGIFFSATVVLVGIAIVVLSIWLPDFIVFEIGKAEEE